MEPKWSRDGDLMEPTWRQPGVDVEPGWRNATAPFAGQTSVANLHAGPPRLDRRSLFRNCSTIPGAPPFDRTIALACAIGTLRARYLHIRCRCGWTTPNPIKFMLTEGRAHPDQTVADVLVRLRCGGGRHKGDLVVHLCEDVYGPGDNLPASIKPGWSVLLHDGVGESPHVDHQRQGRRMTAVYVPVDPEGVVWRRAFRTERAAWRTIVGGTNSEAEWFERKLAKVRQGWRVKPRVEAPQWPVIGARPREECGQAGDGRLKAAH